MRRLFARVTFTRVGDISGCTGERIEFFIVLTFTGSLITPSTLLSAKRKVSHSEVSEGERFPSDCGMFDSLEGLCGG